MRNLVLAGITSKLSGSTLSSLLGGRVYSRYAPENTQFPFAVVDIPTITHDWTFTETIEDLDVYFNLFSKSASESEITGLENALYSLFDNCALTVTGYTHVFMQRDVSNAMHDPDQGIRQVSVIYNCEILK